MIEFNGSEYTIYPYSIFIQVGHIDSATRWETGDRAQATADYKSFSAFENIMPSICVVRCNRNLHIL